MSQNPLLATEIVMKKAKYIITKIKRGTKEEIPRLDLLISAKTMMNSQIMIESTSFSKTKLRN